MCRVFGVVGYVGVVGGSFDFGVRGGGVVGFRVRVWGCSSRVLLCIAITIMNLWFQDVGLDFCSVFVKLGFGWVSVEGLGVGELIRQSTVLYWFGPVSVCVHMRFVTFNS